MKSILKVNKFMMSIKEVALCGFFAHILVCTCLRVKAKLYLIYIFLAASIYVFTKCI